VKLRYTEQAQADIDTAVDWYEKGSAARASKYSLSPFSTP